MKKTKFCFLLVLLTVVTITNFAYAANYLINPGFENGLNDWTDFWGYPSELSSDRFFSGKFSASKEIGFIDREYWSQIFQEVNVQPGQPIYGRIYAMSTFSPLASAKAGLIVQFMDNANNVLGTSLNSAKIGGKTTWRLLEVSAQKAPVGTTKARLSGFIWAQQGDTLSLRNGKAYFDQALLDKVYRVPKLQTILLNRGFENGLNDWTDVYGYPAIIVKTTIHNGLYAARKRVETVASQDYWSEMFQDIACSPGQRITAALYVKTSMDVTSNAKAGLQVKILNAKNQVLQTLVQKVGGKTDWRKLTLVVTSAPAGAKKIRVSGFIYAARGDVKAVGGLAFFDDASLLIKDATAAAEVDASVETSNDAESVLSNLIK